MNSMRKKNKNNPFPLEISEDIKDRILNLSQDLICIAGMDGYFKYVNPAWEKTLGYTREELLSRPFLDFIHPDDHKINDAEVAKLSKGQMIFDFKNRYIHKNGSIRTFSWTATSLVEEKQMYYIGRDITEYRKLKEEIRENELKFRALIENSVDVISLLDVNGLVLYSSPSYTKTMGYPVKKRIGQYTFDLVHPDDRESLLHLFAGIIEKPGQIRIPPARIRHSDGSWRWIEGIANNLLNEPSINAIVVNYRDITEHKQAEDALLNSEREKSAILNTMSELVVYQDINHSIIWVNQAAAQSINRTIDDLKGRKCYEIWAGRKKECEICPITRAIKTGTIQKEEITTPEGRTWSIRGYPLKNETGEIDGCIEVTLDITDRRLAEGNVRTSETRYRELFDHINSGVAVYEAIDNGEDFIFKDFNRAGQRIEKIKKEHVIGKSVLQMFPTIKEFGLFDAFQRVWKTGTPEHHPVTFYKDNRIAGWRENYVYKLPTGEIVAVYDDITQRKQIEKALRESEKNYRELINGMNETAWVIDFNGNLIDVNDTAVEVLGYSKKKLLSIGIFGVDSSLKKQDIKALSRSMKTDQFQIFETSHKTKAGRSFPVEVCSSLIIFQGKPAILSIARDITERKQAEDALRQSEDKFKYIFDHSVVGKSITFPSGEIQVNQAFCDMLGYSYEELQGPKWQDITHPDDIELTQKEIDSILLGEKESARFVKRYIHKNGSVVWVDVGTSLRRDGAGKPLYFMTTVSDISIRMQALHDFKASETRYRRLFESAKDGILILNAEAGLVIDVNPFMIEMLGYAREDFIGKHLWDIGPFKDIAACRDMFFELQKTSYMRYEDLPLATRNGRQIYVEFISIVYSVDNMSVIQCYIRDITDRIHAEEALDREQRLLKVLMDNIPDHIYFKDVNSRFLTINRSLAESFHLSDPDQVAGKTDFDFFTEEHAIQAYNDEQKIIKTGKPVIGIEEKETWSRYEPTWVSTTKMPLIDKDGNIIGTFGISRDITERKLAEEQIKKNLKEKEILIRELYHRTKNNMQVISSILRLRARSLKNTQLIKAFKEIESKILSMALVHQKLYESQDLSQLNLKNYIISLIALIKQLYSEFMSHITIHSNMKDIFVLIDTATPLGLVVNELITNAILHAFPNGRRGEIQVNLDVSRGNAFVLEISDNGIGLPESFDSEKNIHLGLQTVFDLIEEQLNGKIRFKNQNGLHFHLTIHQELYQARI